MKLRGIFSFFCKGSLKRFAFSLIEIMLSLVIIACIFGAFAPLISKKLQRTTIAVGATSSYSKNCSDKYGAACILCTSKACMSCLLDRKAPDGEYLDVDMCAYKECKDLFTTNCLTCAHDRCTLCKPNQYIKSDGTCASCPSGKVCDGVYYCENVCRTCSGSGEGCQSCNSGRYLDGTTCSLCSKINAQCVSCTDAGQCTGCASGYFLSNGTCNAGL